MLCCLLCACADSGRAEVEGRPPEPASTQAEATQTRYTEVEPDEPLPSTCSLEGCFSSEPISSDLQGRITGASYTQDCPVLLDDLALVTVAHYNLDGDSLVGRLIVHTSLAEEVVEIFAELYEARYPIAGIALIEEFDCDDEASMEANNTYSFCTRRITGTDRYSLHSYGAAIDINPVQNPFVVGADVYPEEAADYLDREQDMAGMIREDDPCHTAFLSRGWTWGGEWPQPDYQHFEKELE